MASISKVQTTKSGKKYFKISVSRGYGVSPYTCRFYPQETWSAKVVQRELAKFTAEFELKCKNGEVLNRAETKAKKEAEAAEAAAKKTVRQFVETVWLPNKQIQRNTISAVKGRLEHYVYPEIGNRKIETITALDVVNIVGRMRDANLKPSTQKVVFETLNNVFNYAEKLDAIAVNPCRKVDKPTAARKTDVAKDDDNSSKWLDAGQVADLLESVKALPLMQRCFVVLLVDSWCRRGEACGAMWKNIDFDKGTFSIETNLQRVDGENYVTSPKSGKRRVVDLGAETLAVLRQWRQEQSNVCISQYIFTKKRSPEPITPNAASTMMKRIGKKVGIKKLHCHLLRHSGISIAVNNGVDIPKAAERAGHADCRITMTYIHCNNDGVREAGSAVRSAIKKAKGL